ncbi:MAG: alanine racemase [Holosporales bacterium]|jgi:alanine racemase|nr:alanine racemase [Holosporales bacterium]
MRPKATIDLYAIKENFKTISSIIGAVVCSAVVKADAYGLGAQKVSRALYDVGCRNFWAAYLEEALDVRKVLPLDANIFFLQGFLKSDIDLIKKYKITPVINSLDEFNDIKNQNLGFVIHVDTGLSRLGLRLEDIDEILPFLKEEKIVYVISHLACSDEKNHYLNLKQKNRFNDVLRKIRNLIPVKAGISATSGAFFGKEFYYDIVRVGAFLYGIQTGDMIKPKNVFSLKANVLQKYELEAGVPIGYGATFLTKKHTKIAIISIGYADGIKISLSNNGIIGFQEKSGKLHKAPILGKISMDLIVCDVSSIPNYEVNSSYCAIIINENYSINDMAVDAKTTAYDILSSLKLGSSRAFLEYIG